MSKHLKSLSWHETQTHRAYLRRQKWRQAFNTAREWFWPVVAVALVWMLINPGVWPR